jgi:hypothetical protein
LFYLQKNCKKHKGCPFFGNVRVLKVGEKFERRLKTIKTKWKILMLFPLFPQSWHIYSCQYGILEKNASLK